MTGEEIAWLAGFFEGEGSLDVGHRGPLLKRTARIKLVVQISVVSTDRDVLERAQFVSGLGAIYADSQIGPLGTKQIWRWKVCKRADVLSLVSAMRPWLGSRRRQRVDEAIKAIEEYSRYCKNGLHITNEHDCSICWQARLDRKNSRRRDLRKQISPSFQAP